MVSAVSPHRAPEQSPSAGLRLVSLESRGWETRAFFEFVAGRQLSVGARATVRQRVGRGDRILDSEVNADAADERHIACSIADTEQSWSKPLGEPIDADGQKHIVPALELAYH